MTPERSDRCSGLAPEVPHSPGALNRDDTRANCRPEPIGEGPLIMSLTRGRRYPELQGVPRSPRTLATYDVSVILIQKAAVGQIGNLPYY
jgi:hypothetical protein